MCSPYCAVKLERVSQKVTFGEVFRRNTSVRTAQGSAGTGLCGLARTEIRGPRWAWRRGHGAGLVLGEAVGRWGC